MYSFLGIKFSQIQSSKINSQFFVIGDSATAGSNYSNYSKFHIKEWFMHSKISRDFAVESIYGIIGLINEIWLGSRFGTISHILNTVIKTCKGVLLPSCCRLKLLKIRLLCRCFLNFVMRLMAPNRKIHSQLWTNHAPLIVVI